MTTVILRIDASSMGGNEALYSLTAEGVETRGGTSSTISIAVFLAQYGATLERIAAQARRGWDQVRVHYEATCQTIYEVAIRLPDRRGDRSFGVYGFPYAGAFLEGSRTPVDADLVSLFAYCLVNGRS